MGFIPYATHAARVAARHGGGMGEVICIQCVSHHLLQSCLIIVLLRLTHLCELRTELPNLSRQ